MLSLVDINHIFEIINKYEWRNESELSSFSKELNDTNIDALILERILMVYPSETERLSVVRLLSSKNLLLKCSYDNLFSIVSMFPKHIDELISFLEPFMNNVNDHTIMKLLSLDVKNMCVGNVISNIFNKIGNVDDTLIVQIYSKITDF